MTSSDFYTMIRVSQDPWAFLTEFVKTQDPARGVAAFPDYSYVERLVGAVCNNRFLLVPKSRQMLVTWSMVALFVWKALYRKVGLYLFLSRNERCAEELIERARFVLNHLPRYMRPKLTTDSREEIGFGTSAREYCHCQHRPMGRACTVRTECSGMRWPSLHSTNRSGPR